MNEPQIIHGWHLRKEVSLSHIITTLMVCAAVMKFGYDMDKRITVLETQATNQKQMVQEIKSTVTERLNRIESKLDRLIERA